MAKYGKKTQEHVEDTMHKMKRGKLKSGRAGKGGTVKSKKQAIAIALSESREKGYKLPPQKSEAKNTAAKKPAATKKRRKAAKKSSASKSRSSSTRKNSSKEV